MEKLIEQLKRENHITEEKSKSIAAYLHKTFDLSGEQISFLCTNVVKCFPCNIEGFIDFVYDFETDIKKGLDLSILALMYGTLKNYGISNKSIIDNIANSAKKLKL